MTKRCPICGLPRMTTTKLCDQCLWNEIVIEAKSDHLELLHKLVETKESAARAIDILRVSYLSPVS